MDKDLFSQVVHNSVTSNEFINSVNENRGAYEIYVSDGNAGETLLTDQMLTTDDFQEITKDVITFGEGGVKNAKAPYTPNINLNCGLNYDWKKLSGGISGQYVGDQFTEFHNFKNESADGAIGRLPAYFTMDAFLNYNFEMPNGTLLKVFLNGKNLTNDIYRASRLNRATSGVFPGGFRQIIIGANITI